MSVPATIIRARLIPAIRSTDGSNFIIEGETAYNLFNGVGLRLQCGFFEKDGKTLIQDASTVISAQHIAVKASSGGTYMNQVLAGPMPSITPDQWAAGTHQHLEFQFSDTAMGLPVATDYSVVIFGNLSDALAAVDFACVRPMVILTGPVPVTITNPDNADTILASLKAYVDAQMGDRARFVNKPGDRIALTTLNRAGAGVNNGKYGRIWLAATFDGDGNLILDQQQEFLANI